MNGFVIAIVIVIVVISTIASRKQKMNKQNAHSQPEQPQQQAEPAVVLQERKPLQPRVAQHVVATSFASGHAHQETSMTGYKPCEPSLVSVESAVAQETAAYFDADAARQGVIYAEILSKPLSLRKR